MKRGEVWTVAGGAAYVDKPRPAIVLQSDRFDATESIVICPLTSDATPAAFVRARIAPSAENGLRAASFAMADKIATVPRRRLKRRVGCLSHGDMLNVDRTLLVFLGLAE